LTNWAGNRGRWRTPGRSFPGRYSCLVRNPIAKTCCGKRPRLSSVSSCDCPIRLGQLLFWTKPGLSVQQPARAAAGVCRWPALQSGRRQPRGNAAGANRDCRRAALTAAVVGRSNAVPSGYGKMAQHFAKCTSRRQRGSPWTSARRQGRRRASNSLAPRITA
jgi:hypothetical protein